MKLPAVLLLLPLLSIVRSQTITTFNNRAAFEAAMGNFKIVDDFSLGGTFLNGTTTNGAINASGKWADVAQNPPPSTTWATPFGSTAFGGTWDTTVAGVGGGLEFELDFGGGTIVTVPGGVAGNAPANTFFGFTADMPFLNVRMRLPAAAVLGETHTLDDLTVQVTADFADARFAQAGAGVWDTAGHWDIAAPPGPNQRTFIFPAGGSVVSGPAAAASVRQIVLGDGTAASRLNLDAAGTLTAAGGVVVKANSTLGGAGRLAGPLTMAAGSTLTVADGQTLQAGSATANGVTVGGTITVGTGTLILEDTGATALGALTTLAGGGLTALGGTAQAGTGDTLRGFGSLTGAFELQGTGQIRAQGGPLNIAQLTIGGGTLRAETGDVHVAQLTSSGGTMTVDAARTLSITSTSTGLTNSAATSVGAGGTLSSGGLLNLFGGTTLGAGATVSGAGGLYLSEFFSHAGAQVFNAGTGDLRIESQSFIPDAEDSLLGARLVMGFSGTIRISSEASLGTAGNQLVFTGGTLFTQSSMALPVSRSIVMEGNGTIAAPNGIALDVAGDITGAGRLILAGSSGGNPGGTIRLTGANTHAGGTEIAGATLEAASDAQFGGVNGILNIGRPNGSNPIAGTLRALGNITVPATRTTTFQNATVDTNGFDVTFNQPITGLHLTKNGEGVLRLNTKNANDTTTHFITLNAGTLRTGVNDALGLRASLFPAADTTFDLNGFNHELQSVSGDGNIALGAGTLTTRGGGTIGGIISGAGGVVIKFSSSRLLGENTFSGGLTVREGASVSVKTTAGFGGAGNSVLLDNGGISSDFEATAPVVIGAAFPMTIAAGGATFGANSQPLIIEAQLTGANPLRVRGGGTGFEVRFAHAANTFTGNIQLGDSGFSGFGRATLGIVADGSLGNPANIVTLGDAFNTGEGFRTSTGTLRIFADVVIPPTRAIRLKGQDGEGGGGVFDTNGHTLTVNTALSELGSGELDIRGGGTVFLNAANTFTGDTTVEDATLVVNGSLSGETQVASGGTLSGTGTTGNVRVFFGGTLAPGSSPGTLHTGDVTFSGGSSFALEFASPALADQLDVTGSVTLNSGVELSLALGYTPAGTDTFVVINNDGADPVETFGGSSFFAIAGNPLEEGETFTAAGANWKISYTGGDGNDVTLTVTPAAAGLDLLSFDIGTPAEGGSGVQVQGSLSGPPGAVVRLLRSSDLIDWTLLSTITLDGSGSAAIDVPDPAATVRAFYQLISP